MDNNANRADMSPTPFDDVFKTECEKLKPFLVPLIKEIFGLECTIEENAPIHGEANERYLIDGATPVRVSRRFTDSCLRIGNRLYHVECESGNDGSIIFRLAEYNMRIAIDNASLDEVGNTIVVRLPESGLLRLRDSQNIKKISSATMRYEYNDQSISINIPVMNVQAYTADDIYDKGLYFLIPFYCIRFEKQLREKSETPYEEYDRIYVELKEYFERLTTMCDTGRITEDETRKLAELSRIILNYITVDLDNEIRERMVSVVGGQVLELQEDRWLKEGMEIGIEKGIEKGKITARFEDGMPVEKIAERTSVSIEVVKAVLRDAGLIKE